MELEELRKEIDALDQELLKVLAKRMQISEQVANGKNENDIVLKQPEREKQLIERVRAEAGSLGLSQEFAERLWKLILEESVKVQEES